MILSPWPTYIKASRMKDKHYKLFEQSIFCYFSKKPDSQKILVLTFTGEVFRDLAKNIQLPNSIIVLITNSRWLEEMV